MKTINLLPKPKQRDLYYERLFGALAVFLVIAAGTFVFVILAQVGTKVFLGQRSSQLAAKIEQVKNAGNKQDNAEVKAKVKQQNAYIQDYSALAAATPAWSQVLKAFAQDVPEGVVIQTFSSTVDKKNIDITGFSPTREKVIELYNNIVADTVNFSAIDYPLENVSKPTDVPFHFTFTINDSLLQLQQNN